MLFVWERKRGGDPVKSEKLKGNQLLHEMGTNCDAEPEVAESVLRSRDLVLRESGVGSRGG